LPNQIVYCGRSSRPDSIGGSCTIRDIEIENHNYRVVIDCGPEVRNEFEDTLQPVTPDFSFIEEDGKKVDAVVLTHAHTDHVGAVAMLARRKLLAEDAKIFASPQTSAFLPYVLEDGLKHAPEYTAFDIAGILNRRQVIEKPGEVEILPDLKMFVFQNGHGLPGSFGLVLDDGLFTGDFCFQDMPTTKGLQLPSVAKWPSKYLPRRIDGSDCTYTGKAATTFESEVNRMYDAVDRVMQNDGTVIFAAFASGRTQNLAMLLTERFGVPVYIDGLGRTFYRICQEQRWNDNDAMLPKLGGKRGIKIVSDKTRDDLIQSSEPKIVITTGGMGSFGPILSYMDRYLPDRKSAVFFSSWLAPGTNGEKLLRLALKHQEGFSFSLKERNGSESVQVRAAIDRFSMSGHGGQDDSIKFFGDIMALRGGVRFDSIACAHGTHEGKREALDLFTPLAHQIFVVEQGTRIVFNC